MVKMIKHFWVFGAVLLLCACGGGRTSSEFSDGDTLQFGYAENLKVIRFERYKMAELRNPWDTLKTLHTYILVDRDEPLPENLPEGTVVRVPLSRSVVYSSVHCGLIQRFGKLSAIGGVCDLKYIRMPEIHEGCREGRIVDAGSGMSPDIEKIISLHPDGILLSPFENSGGYGRIEKLDVPIIECADYMETSALGRAEWMRFYGMLYGCEELADSLFGVSEREYLALCGKVSAVTTRPKVFCELKSGSAWYVPGARSTVGRLYADAGADYVFAGLENSGSSPLSFETVFDKAHEADVWLIKYSGEVEKTYRELERDYAPYAGFRAFRERNIYGCNTTKVNYYEDTPFYPELILKDLIGIFHPELMEDYALKYFSKLAE